VFNKKTMKNFFKLLFLSLFILSCNEKLEISSINPVNWEKRAIKSELPESMLKGTTYLSVYSQIYSQTEHRTFKYE